MFVTTKAADIYTYNCQGAGSNPGWMGSGEFFWSHNSCMDCPGDCSCWRLDGFCCTGTKMWTNGFISTSGHSNIFMEFNAYFNRDNGGSNCWVGIKAGTAGWNYEYYTITASSVYKPNFALPSSADNSQVEFQFKCDSHDDNQDQLFIDNIRIYSNPTTPMPTTSTTSQPTSASPTTSIPTTSQPTTVSPTTLNPTTNVPTTSAPTTTANPTTSIPTTTQPTTSAPTTSSPTTNEPTTNVPTTDVPTTTASPTTSIPTTSVPTTSQPTTAIPTTLIPTTNEPTTSIPTTTQPSTSQPTTSNPTTVIPTTSNPTTSQPTTLQPTTNEPTTFTPTTSNPTTIQPSTSQPTTNEPTQVPSYPTTQQPTIYVAQPTDATNDAAGEVTEENTFSGDSKNVDAQNDSDSAKFTLIIALLIVLIVICACMGIAAIAFCVYYHKGKPKGDENQVNNGIEMQETGTIQSDTGTNNGINSSGEGAKSGFGVLDFHKVTSISNIEQVDEHNTKLDGNGEQMNGTGDILYESENDSTDTDDNMYGHDDHVTAGGQDNHVTAGGDDAMDIGNKNENENDTYYDAMYDNKLQNMTKK